MSAPENSYNRPSYPHICGRAKLWGKPCPLGPNVDGSCGGVQECKPTRSGDRWKCCRPRSQGGACANGPLPDGTCANTQPPCRPSASVRITRFRLVAVAAFLTVALLFAFGSGGNIVSSDDFSFKNAGPLRAGHAESMSGKGCVDCHEPHEKNASMFLAAITKNSAPDSAENNKCLDCHVIGTSAGDPHKVETCVSCHKEHAGLKSPVTSMTDAQCHSCHKVKFASFSEGHPVFKKGYPYDLRTSLNFDHNRHLLIHFADARYKDKAPSEGETCISCHDTTKAGRNVPIKSFEASCAACHNDKIKSKALTVFELPEFEKNPFDFRDFEEVCRSVNVEAEDEFESVSTEQPNPISAMLFDFDPEEIGKYSGPIAEFLKQSINNGPSFLEDKIKDLDGNSADMLNGLSAEMLMQAACAWVANQEYEGPEISENGGWFADELSIKYRARKHGDPVMKAWLDFAADQENDPVSESLLVSDGPGGCISCHGVSETDAVRIGWKSVTRPAAPNFKYPHKPHLNVLGPGTQCQTCHVIDKSVDTRKNFEQLDPEVFKAGFKQISIETCSQCHNKQRVDVGCRGCHSFHGGENSFAKRQFKHKTTVKKDY